MKTSIEEVRYLDYRGIKIASPAYEAVVLPERGANLIRFYHRGKNVAILREPESVPDLEEKKYEYGTPVLFFPNRIEDGKFVFDLREYLFPVNEPKTRCHLHGFLHNKIWLVEDAGISDSGNPFLRLSYSWGSASEEELRLFPHAVLFTLEFDLTDAGLRQTVIIENRGNTKMPVGFGYHTSFSVPRGGSYTIDISVGQKWEMTERHFPSGKLADPGEEGELNLNDGTGRVFGHYTLREKPFEETTLYGAVIGNVKDKYHIEYLFDKSYNNLVIWNKTGEDGFICIEPQTCAINAYNIDMPDSITGRRTLDGGAVFKASTKISLKECGI